MSNTFNCHYNREIGGYFGLEQLLSDEYYKDLIALNTARNALLYVLRAKKINKVYIPLYLCDSISKMLRTNSYNFEYYNIDDDFNPIFNKLLQKDEFIYIVNYFGQMANERMRFFKRKYNNIIVDNVMAFFQKPLKGIDTIYSCRKFFGVPDGAYLSTDTKLNEEIDSTSSKDRMKHLLGRYECTAFEYYTDFQRNEISLGEEPLKKMSKITTNILGAIDYQKVKLFRNRNYAYIESRLKEINKLKIVAPDGAFTYPFYVENGIKLRKELAEDKIYVPTLWPNVLKNAPKNSVEYKYTSNILPLSCDQRYCENDLEFMCSKLIHILKKNNYIRE